MASSTIRNILSEYSLPAQVCPEDITVESRNRLKRLEFCREKHAGFPWKNVFFRTQQ